MSLKEQSDCFNGFSKIIILFLIPIIVGYIIIEIEKIDSIRTKKMESFEIIIDSFNEISKKAFSDESMSEINLIYNTMILSVDNTEISKGNDILKKSALKLKLDKLKLDRIISYKQLEVEKDTLFSKIQHHENLLKGYYGYSINDNILPISKMLSIIKYNSEQKEKLNQSLLNILEEIEPLLFRQVTMNNEEELTKIVNIIKQKVDNWMLENNKIFETSQKLNILFKKESVKLYEDIYNTYMEELRTSLFKLYTNKNKENFSQIIYSQKNEIIKLEVLENDNGEFYFNNI